MRCKSPRAAQRLIELMEGDDERVALMAADKVYERAWGRPRDYDPRDRPGSDPPLLSPEQLDLVEHALRLMVTATRRQSETVEVAMQR